jgi:hypothetical protein
MRSFLIFSIFLCIGLRGNSICAHSANDSRLSFQSFEKGCELAGIDDFGFFSNNNFLTDGDDSFFGIEDEDDEYRNDKRGLIAGDGLKYFSSSSLDYPYNSLANNSAFGRQTSHSNYLLYIVQRSLLI